MNISGMPEGPAASPPTLSVVVVNWNTKALLRKCLLSLLAHPAPVPTTIWVVDNASTDGSPQMVREEFPGVRILAMEENLGFSGGNNVALRLVDSDFVLLLNPDAEVLPGTLETALSESIDSGTAVAVRLLNPDGSLQHSCFRFPSLIRDLAEGLWLHRFLPRRLRGRIFLGGYWDHDEDREVDWALGAFLLVPTEATEVAGLLPEEYPLFGEDMEWSMRLREAGFPLRFSPACSAIHHGNQAGGQHPPPWRIRRTHAAQDRFLRVRRGNLVAHLHRSIMLLGYALRTGLFSVMGVVSPIRRRQGREYRAILRTLLGREEAGGGIHGI